MIDKTVTLSGPDFDVFDRLQRLIDNEPNAPTMSDGDIVALALVSLLMMSTMPPDTPIERCLKYSIIAFETHHRSERGE